MRGSCIARCLTDALLAGTGTATLNPFATAAARVQLSINNAGLLIVGHQYVENTASIFAIPPAVSKGVWLVYFCIATVVQEWSSIQWKPRLRLDLIRLCSTMINGNKLPHYPPCACGDLV